MASNGINYKCKTVVNRKLQMQTARESSSQVQESKLATSLVCLDYMSHLLANKKQKNKGFV